MHILFLTDNFPPEVNAPASRTFEHCREWVKAGQEVTVITCFPNFPKGKVYDGYRNRLRPQTETIDGIRVIRVWSYITANEGFVKRILDYMSFMVSAVVASPAVNRPDVVIGTSPHFFTACAAYLVSRIKRVPFVFELRDIWPESIKAVGAMNDSAVIRLLEKVEMFLYRKAALIVSVTESFKKTLVRRGVTGEKIHVVRNGVDLARFRPMPKDPELVKRYGLKGKFVAGYIGTHGMAHALETLLDAAQKIGTDTYLFSTEPPSSSVNAVNGDSALLILLRQFTKSPLFPLCQRGKLLSPSLAKRGEGRFPDQTAQHIRLASRHGKSGDTIPISDEIGSCPQIYPAPAPSPVFLFLGDGARKQELMAEARRRGLDNVLFLDSVPKEKVVRYWSLLDVSIIHLRKTELFTMVIPSKLFESMGMGIPVLLGVAGESAEIVEKEGVGLTFEPENAEALCDALLRLRDSPDLYGRLRDRCIRAAGNYDRETQAAAMLVLLTSSKENVSN